MGGVIGYQLAHQSADDADAGTGGGDALLVGLAAVFVGLIAHIEMGRVLAWTRRAASRLRALPPSGQERRRRDRILRVELFLGIFIGAITFTGSVVAYGKLAGKVDTAAEKLPGGHLLNAGAAAFV